MKNIDSFIRKTIYDEDWRQLNLLIKLGIVKLEDVVRVVIETKDTYYIYFFALKYEEFYEHVEGAPIGKLAQAMIETEDAVGIYLFARDIKEAPIYQLACGVNQIGNAKSICLFAFNVESAPIGMLVDRLIELKSYYYIGLILSAIGAKDNVLIKNVVVLGNYALEHKDELLEVLTECTNIGCLHTIRQFLNDDGLVDYVNQLILKLYQEPSMPATLQCSQEEEKYGVAGFFQSMEKGPCRNRECTSNQNWSQ